MPAIFVGTCRWISFAPASTDPVDATLLAELAMLSDIHCVQKKHPLTFFSYLHELFVDLNKNCSEYTQGLIDSDNVKLDIHCDR